MKGGKLIGTGSQSCVFSPNIPCPNQEISKNHVSKLLFHPEHEKMSKNEEKQSNLIKKIKGYKEWAVVYDTYCNALPPSEVKELDPNGFKACFKHETTYTKAKNLISENGGDTLNDVFLGMFKGETNLEIINQKFKKFISMCYPLFFGLYKMDDNNIVHLDIKSINITGDKTRQRYIDFGLASKTNNLRHFQERCVSELNTKRIYFYYPLDYIFFYVDRKNIVNEFSVKISQRRNYPLLKELYKLMGYDINKVLQGLLTNLINFKYTINDVIKKIDVYGLGITIITLFYNIYKGEIMNIINYNEMITDFFKLFKAMINPELRERVTAADAFDIYGLLMEKHSIGHSYTPPKPSPEKEKRREPKKNTVRREPRREPKRKPKGEPRREPRREPKRKPKGEPRRESKRDSKRKPRRESKRDSKRKPRREPKRKPKGESRREPRREPKRKPKGESRRESKRDSKRKPRRESKRDSKRKPRRESKRDSKRKPRRESKGESRRKPRRESKGESRRKPRRKPRETWV